MSEEIETLRDRLNMTESWVDIHRNQVRDLEHRIAELRNREGAMSVQVDRLNTEITNARNEIASLRAENSGMTRSFDATTGNVTVASNLGSVPLPAQSDGGLSFQRTIASGNVTLGTHLHQEVERVTRELIANTIPLTGESTRIAVDVLPAAIGSSRHGMAAKLIVDFFANREVPRCPQCDGGGQNNYTNRANVHDRLDEDGSWCSGDIACDCGLRVSFDCKLVPSGPPQFIRLETDRYYGPTQRTPPQEWPEQPPLPSNHPDQRASRSMNL